MGFSSGNPIITHNGMEAEVILASCGPEQRPIYTMRVRCPRIIWAEMMTHRVFGRNARSSRAVPFKTLLAELRSGAGFMPDHWTANQGGMQGVDGHNAPVLVPLLGDAKYEVCRERAWQDACDSAAKYAEAFANAEYHKQLANRIIEPFMMIDAIITSTDWENFFWLRDHGAAEPHLQDLARIMHEAMQGVEIQLLEPGEWHLPYITEEDWVWAQKRQDANGGLGETLSEILLPISAARCARVSYAPFDGNATYEKELERYDLLVSSDRVHASPLEHQASPDKSRTTHLSAVLRPAVAATAGRGLVQPEDRDLVTVWQNAHLHGNLVGYLQYRKLVPNEAYHG